MNSPLGDYSRITSLSLFPNRDGFGMGSVDGRGHMSNILIKTNYNGPSHYDLKNIMTFKAHKVIYKYKYKYKYRLKIYLLDRVKVKVISFQLIQCNSMEEIIIG